MGEGMGRSPGDGRKEATTAPVGARVGADEPAAGPVVPPPGVHRMGEHPRTRQERPRKSDRTRARILEAAAALVASRGTTDFQMREVAEAAGVAKSSLYYYYRDHDELVDAVLASQLSGLMDAMGSAAEGEGGPEEALARICAAMARAASGGAPLLVCMARGVARTAGLPGGAHLRLRELTALIARIQARARAQGLGWREVPASTVAVALVGSALVEALGAMGEGAAASRTSEAAAMYRTSEGVADPVAGRLMDLLAGLLWEVPGPRG